MSWAGHAFLELADGPAGALISGLGALQRSGGGQAAWSAARRAALAEGAQFVLLQPLDSCARRWWEGWGFKPIADALRLRRHRRHNCDVSRLTHQRLTVQLCQEITVNGADIEVADLITVLQESFSGVTPPFILWLHRPSPSGSI